MSEIIGGRICERLYCPNDCKWLKGLLAKKEREFIEHTLGNRKECHDRNAIMMGTSGCIDKIAVTES
jgi:hypothetical protein